MALGWRLNPPALDRLSPSLIAWQGREGRHGLPWQGSRDPYRVWLSEIMLQQTQVKTVLGYYAQFLARFPDVAALADAPLDEVLSLWQGLGYYSRARNLHRCAQAVVAEHGGRFPATAAGLARLPGIGPSTAAAIAAFCYGERVAILDGNVKRVLARALGFEGDVGVAREQQALWQLATQALPAGPGIEAYTQGLMDLGATVCTPRQPACGRCPWQADCVAHATGRTAALPVKARRLRRGARSNALLWLQRPQDGAHWLVQRPETGVWAGLWAFPEFDDLAALDAAVADWPGELETLPAVKHVLTHLDWQLTPVRLRLADAARPGPDELLARWPTGRWVAPAALAAHGLPTPVRRWLRPGED